MVRAAIIPFCLLSFAGLGAMGAPDHREAIETFCLSCHDAETKKGNLDLEAILGDPVEQHAAVWEKVVRQLNARQMPPIAKRRPDEAGFNEMAGALTAVLDREAAEHPQPGRTDTLRRMTRTEY